MRKLDDKAVSVLLGFILVMMISMLALSIAQTTLVPDICKQAEADHIDTLTSEILRANQITTTPFDLKLDMGVKYPRYPFLFIPPTTTSTLSSETFPVEIRYTEILPNGSSVNRTMSLLSKRIVITPNYFYYPKTSLIVENTAIFKGTDRGFIAVTDQRAFKKTVNFVILNTTFTSLSTASPLDLVFVPVSVGGDVLAEDITISFESVYPEYWNRTLTQLGYKVDISGNNVTVKIDERTSLAISTYYVFSGVSVSSQQAMQLMETLKPVPHRIVKINPLDRYELKLGETIILGAKVLDEYNNPVEGVEVSVDVEGGIGVVSPSKAYTDESGAVHVVFSAKNSSSGKVVFTCEECKDVKTVEYAIDVVSTVAAAGNVSINLWSDPPENEDGYSNKTIYAKVLGNGEPLPGYEVVFATNSSNAVLSKTKATTDYNGIATTEVSQKVTGKNWYRVYGYAGSAVDKIDVLLNTTLSSPDIHVLKIYVENQLDTKLEGYQVRIVIKDPDILSKIQSDGSDIRLFERLVDDPYNETGGKLPYWIESITQDELAIWTKLDLGSEENKTIFMYFNKTGVSSESNGDAVFEFFDDFEGNSLNTSKWDTNIKDKMNKNSKYYRISNGYIKMRSNRDNIWIASKDPISKPFVVEARGKLSHVDEDIDLLIYYASEKTVYRDVSPGTLVFRYDGQKDSDKPSEQKSITYYVKGENPYVLGGKVGSTDWQRLICTVEDTARFWDSYFKQEIELIDMPSYSTGYIHIAGDTDDNKRYAYLDYILVRKYAEKDPKVTIGELLQ